MWKWEKNNKFGMSRSEDATLVQWIGQLNENIKRGTSFNGICGEILNKFDIQ